jgi:hypothetical protein
MVRLVAFGQNVPNGSWREQALEGLGLGGGVNVRRQSALSRSG